jgi:hypothetical protein
MAPQCLSVCGPCESICDACVQSHNRAVLDQAQRDIQRAVNLLKTEGFVLTAPAIDSRPANDALRILLETNRIKL